MKLLSLITAGLCAACCVAACALLLACAAFLVF